MSFQVLGCSFVLDGFLGSVAAITFLYFCIVYFLQRVNMVWKKMELKETEGKM